MPNVKGLESAPDLIKSMAQGASAPYGPHCTVQIGAGTAILTSADGTVTLATFNGVKPQAGLKRIDGDTVTAVNAFLKPYGKVKAYWRTGEYRWHPINGKATAPTGAVASPVAKPVTQPAPVATPAAPVIPVTVTQTVAPITFKVNAGGGSGVTIATERRHEGKAPKVRTLTKTFSQVDDVLVPTVDLNTLERAWTMRQAGHPSHVLITGPAGTAKTRLAQAFAFSKGVPFLVVEGQGIQTAADWYGGFVPSTTPGQQFEWVWSDFGLALLRGEPMVILIDEINRPENERALNGLMGLMAWTASTKPVGAPVALTLSPGILIMATLNEGIEYVGTVEIDAAVRDRFASGVRMDYTPKVIEARLLKQFAPGLDAEVAKRLVNVAATQRAKRDDDTLFPSHNVISTRVLIDIAQTIESTGCSPTEAIWSSARARFQREDDDALSVLIEAQFGAAPEALDTLPDDEDIDRYAFDQDALNPTVAQ